MTWFANTDINLSYHWLQGKEVLVFDGPRTPLPCSLAPGEDVLVDCMVQTPDVLGAYTLELDLVQERVSWFNWHGSETCRLPLLVGHTPRFTLHFTGNCTAEQFAATCAQQDWWYHSYYFDNGLFVRGDYDIGANVHEYEFPDDMTGMSVLDIGTGGGWFAVYFAQRGAAVTAVDVRGICDYDIRGGRKGPHLYPPIESVKPKPDVLAADGMPLYFSRVSRSLWIMKDILGLPIEYINSRIYDIRPGLFGGRQFDLVFIGALLLHLRDPIGGLMAARTVCRNQLIATTPVILDGSSHPAMEMIPVSDGAWWKPNKSCFERWFLDAGFAEVDTDDAVTLTGEAPLPCCDSPTPGAIRNGTQRLQLGRAKI